MSTTDILVNVEVSNPPESSREDSCASTENVIMGVTAQSSALDAGDTSIIHPAGATASTSALQGMQKPIKFHLNDIF